jgi:hypothetical protein
MPNVRLAAHSAVTAGRFNGIDIKGVRSARCLGTQINREIAHQPSPPIGAHFTAKRPGEATATATAHPDMMWLSLSSAGLSRAR